MASATMVSGLDRLCEAVEAAEAAARRQQGFVCPHPGCARVFSKRYNQQAHMRLHDGTRPFSCPRCNKHFMWKSSLKSHAKMHQKMDAAAAALAAKRTPPNPDNALKPDNRLPAPVAHNSSRTNAVAKRRTNSTSPTRKLSRRVSKKSTPQSNLIPTAHSTSPPPPQQSPHIASPQVPPPKPPLGRQSPESITRIDLETATLLTMFR